MTTYINFKNADGTTETASEAETYKQARLDCKEYNFADPTHHYYTSSRSTKDYRER